MDSKKLIFIIRQFFLESEVLNIDLINTGNINTTYIVEHIYRGEKSKFVLQRLSNIFESHQIVNMNHQLVTDHIKDKLKKNRTYIFRQRWVIPDLIKCESNNLSIFPFEYNSWRAMNYIDDSLNFSFLQDNKMAFEIGIGLAKFHFLCSDIDTSKIVKSIKNFHDTNFYINQYLKSLKDFDFHKLDKIVFKRVQFLLCKLSDHIEYVESLIRLLNNELVEYKVIHGDPKLSNFLFDKKSRFVVSLIDLDTLTSGNLLIDLADCIRSICNPAGEDPKDLESVCFGIGRCKNFLDGYFSIANYNDYYSFRSLPEFIYIIIFELTIRFLTDFLQGNIYFNIEYETHNLYRAEVQFRLLSSFLCQISDLILDLKQIGICSRAPLILDVRKFT